MESVNLDSNGFKRNQIENEVAIIGLGFRLPGSSNDPGSLWNNLVNKFDGVVDTSERWSDNYWLDNEIKSNQAGLISLEDEIKKSDPLMFSIADSSIIDPQQLLLLKCTWEALEDSNINPNKLRGTNTSVYIGVSTLDFQSNLKTEESLSNIFGSSGHSASNRISYCYDLRGQSLSIDTACSSSSNAIGLGYQSIVDGHSVYSIVGGSSLLLDPTISKAFTNLNMLGKSGRCRTFSSNPDGYVRGEGVGIAVLKNLKQAIKDGDYIYCVLNGYNSNTDGSIDKNNFYSPSKFGQYENIKELIRKCKNNNVYIKESNIDYVECHGTGTAVGDLVETEALSMIFKDHNNDTSQLRPPLLIGSIKSNIGHTEACSGIASLIKCCLMFKYRQFVPNINFNEPNPLIKFDEWNLKVVTETTEFPETKNVSMLINNFGITGSNVCMLLSEYNENNYYHSDCNTPTITYEYEPDKYYLIPMSANSKQSLNSYINKLQTDYQHYSNNIEFFNFVQLQILSKSTQLYQRSVILANKWLDIKNNDNIIKTSSSITSNILASTKPNLDTNICFVFSGQGTQSIKMFDSQLYQQNSIFKSTIDSIDLKLSKYFGYSIVEKIKSMNEADIIINYPIYAQPSICMIQIALYEMLTKQWNINPNFIIGHSLGELTSQYCSGSIDLDTLCYILYNRSIAQNKTIGCGKMLSINIGENEFKEKYSTQYPTIEISGFNSISSIVIGGDENLLKEIESSLKTIDIHTAFLSTPSSFHTSSQDQIKEDILNLQFHSNQSNIPVLSTVYKDFFNSDSNKFSPEYCFRNIREPVYFTQTISKLYQHIQSNQLGNNLIFIELSPHSALTYHLKQSIPSATTYFKQISVYSTLNRNKSDMNQIHKLISTLYCDHNLSSINFNNQLKINEQPPSSKSSYKLNLINLPKYQWDDKKIWKEESNELKLKLNGPPIEILGNKIFNSPFISYKTIIDIDKPVFQYLKGHQVKGKYYFPGCGYIENILNSFPPNTDLIINCLEFKKPLIFIEGVPRELQTNIYQQSKKDYRVQFHYYEPNSSKWIQTSSGNLQVYQFNNSNEKKDNIDRLKSICNLAKLNSQDFYYHVRVKTGLTYTGHFQSITECHIGKNSVLSKIAIKPLNESIVDTIANCSSLDCFVHGCMALIKDTCQLVFDRFENFRFYSTNLPKQYSGDFYSYILLSERKGDSFEFNVTVMLEDGTVIFEIEKGVMTSLIPVIDSLSIQYPINVMQSTYLQPKYCEIITNLEIFNNTDYQMEYNQSNLLPYYKFISSILYYHINDKLPELSIEEIKLNDIQILKNKYFINNNNDDDSIQQSRLFEFVFSTIKDHHIEKYDESKWNENNLMFYTILSKTTKTIVDLLFPLGDPDKLDKPQSIYENNLLENFYANKHIKISDILLSDLLKDSLKPLVKKKNVIRIIEFGGGVGSLSIEVLKKIDQLFVQGHSDEIEIEYTYSDISSTFIPYAKEKLSFFNNNNNSNGNKRILFKVLNLEDELIKNQNLKPSYYDFVIMSNVLHVLKRISFGLDQIRGILKNDGYLLFVEPLYKSIIGDTIFGVFKQWWTFEDTDLRNDRCCMTEDQWFSILKSFNFKNIKFSNNNGISNLLIHCQKQQRPHEIDNNSNIIIYGENILNFSNNKIINSNEEFKKISNEINENTIIYFTKSINQLNINNFKEITLQYIQIVQFLISNELWSTKAILLTSNCFGKESSNFLASSLIGSFRYFIDQFELLLLFSFDFDNDSLQSLSEKKSLESIISNLIDQNNNFEKEFIIRNNKIYIEKIKEEFNIFNKFKCDSIIQPNKSLLSSNSILYSKLNENLEFQLDSKQQQHLGINQVEIQVKAIGLNYKDYLVYTRMVPPELINHNSDIHCPEFGLEFSGVVKSIGSNVENFKIGDEVYSVHFNASSSSIIVDKNHISLKPSNISFSEAASIPAVYLTSYHSIFKIGNLKKWESILIHSATGGVGLSSIELLRWKGFKGHLFVTVGSKEKEEYLLNKYGSFITGIYSTRNKDYVGQIKNKLKELSSNNKQGVDLILNTLSSEYIESNFRCLNPCGRIVDLSITHLSSNDFIDFSKFKYNYTYTNVELLLLDYDYLNGLLIKISKGVSSGELSLIPITEYSVLNIKDAFEFINQRKHIGKIIVNYDLDITNYLLENLNNNAEQVQKEPIMKSNYSISDKLGKTILITGQSGIALEVLKWINKHSKSVENIIVLSKSSIKWELELLINSNKENTHNKINIYFKCVDVEYYDEITQAINQVLKENQSIQSIDTIFHFAFKYDACQPLEVGMTSLNDSHGAKTIGAVNLHNLTVSNNWVNCTLILASSVAALLGSFNLCSYVGANSILDSLSKHRKSINLPTLSINWGHIGTTGIVTKKESVGELLGGLGLEPIPANIILGSLDLFIQNIDQDIIKKDFNNILINKMNYEKMPHSNTFFHKLDYKLNAINRESDNAPKSNTDHSIIERVISKLSELLSINQDNINTNLKLSEYGADSLLVVQMKNWVDKEFKKNLFSIQELQSLSINLIIQKLMDNNF